MKVTVIERVSLVYGGIIPVKGNILEMSTAKQITEKLDFDSKEKEIVGLKINPQGMITVSEEKRDEEKEFAFNAEELSLLNKNITKLDKENNVRIGDVSICLKIQTSVKKEIK